MNDFEKDLRNALERTPPPEGFADRVMKRVAREGKVVSMPARTPFWRSRWATAAIAATLVLSAGGLEYRRRQEAAQGERAKQQVMLALEIASSKLAFAERVTQQRLERLNLNQRMVQ